MYKNGVVVKFWRQIKNFGKRNMYKNLFEVMVQKQKYIQVIRILIKQQERMSRFILMKFYQEILEIQKQRQSHFIKIKTPIKLPEMK